MRRLTHAEEFAASPEQIFLLLHTPSLVAQWWGVERAIILPESGGIWAATWGNDIDAPDYAAVADIKVFDPPRRMVLENYRYRAKSGPLPFEAEFVTEFLVEPSTGGVQLTVTQDGFPVGPEADEYFAGCEKGWGDTFAGIRRILTEIAGPDSA